MVYNQVPPRWIAPPVGVTKINVYAAIGESSKTAITTAVVRDEAGTSLVIVMKRITNLETLETMVCREDLCLANDLYLRKSGWRPIV
jgi:hypothetical protein